MAMRMIAAVAFLLLGPAAMASKSGGECEAETEAETDVLSALQSRQQFVSLMASGEESGPPRRCPCREETGSCGSSSANVCFQLQYCGDNFPDVIPIRPACNHPMSDSGCRCVQEVESCTNQCYGYVEGTCSQPGRCSAGPPQEGDFCVANGRSGTFKYCPLADRPTTTPSPPTTTPSPPTTTPSPSTTTPSPPTTTPSPTPSPPTTTPSPPTTTPSTPTTTPSPPTTTPSPPTTTPSPPTTTPSPPTTTPSPTPSPPTTTPSPPTTTPAPTTTSSEVITTTTKCKPSCDYCKEFCSCFLDDWESFKKCGETCHSNWPSIQCTMDKYCEECKHEEQHSLSVSGILADVQHALAGCGPGWCRDWSEFCTPLCVAFFGRNSRKVQTCTQSCGAHVDRLQSIFDEYCEVGVCPT